MYSTKVFLSFFIIWSNIFANAQDYSSYFTDKLIEEGLMFPRTVKTFIGEDVVFKLKRSIQNQEKCTYRRPGSDTDVLVPSDMRASSWDASECGVRLFNVTKSDEGFWRLRSTNENDFMQGVGYIEVTDDLPSYDEIDSNTFRSNDEFTPDNTEYCYVYRPGAEKANSNNEFPRHSRCIIPNIDLDPEANGIWNVRVGVEKKMNEIEFEIDVSSYVQKLVSSFERTSDGATLLKCNFENFHANNEIEFCRFARVRDNFGVNSIEGMGNQKYSYYGKGLAKGECGLQITKPDERDKSLWKCYIGLKQIRSSQGKADVEIQSTVGAIIDISDVPSTLSVLSATKSNSLSKQKLNILCESSIAIEYCWFKHPDGSIKSVTDQSEENDEKEFWYHGNGFQLGHCGITINKSDIKDSGKWSCNVGIVNKPQWQVSTEFDVRVTDSNLVAQSQSITTAPKDNLLLECSTIPANTPLEYCRFVLPNGEGFSINENITSSKAFEGKYLFDPNRRLSSGYCSIIVKSVNSDDAGTWSCAAKLLGWTEESFDTMNVEVVGRGLSVGSIIGMAFGVAFALSSLFGIVIYRQYKQRKLLENAPLSRMVGTDTDSVHSGDSRDQ